MLWRRHPRFRPEKTPRGFTLLYEIPLVNSKVYKLGWSPDGSRLAAGCSDQKIRIWDAKTGKELQSITGHGGEVLAVAWSPDGRFLASGAADGTVRLWDPAKGQLLESWSGHDDFVSAVAWSPDGRRLVSGSGDWSIRIMVPGQGTNEAPISGHSGYISSVLWSPDASLLASASGDKAVHLWDGSSALLSRKLYGHSSDVYDVAWSPDSSVIASASEDRTVRIWNVKSGRQVEMLEGHSEAVFCVSFSPEGRLLCSKSDDDTVRLWKSRTWELLAILIEPTSGDDLGGVAFHPDRPILATHGTNSTSVRIWRLDYATLFGGKTQSETRFYKNAKVVLLGDTGVGKTGLSLALSGQPFVPTESTHGRHIWTFESKLVETSGKQKETRETLLWDLAGQPGYRLLHQLYLNEIAVALIVFDSRHESEPFSGVKYWDRALRQAQAREGGSVPVRKFLVAARSDRGALAVSRERVEAVLREGNFSGYFETSAKTGWSIQELAQAIRTGIDWELVPRVVSTELFETIRQFLLEQKKIGTVRIEPRDPRGGYGIAADSDLLLTTIDDLYRLFTVSYPYFSFDSSLKSKFDTCIALMESRDLIRRLSFGGYILLQPELLDAYASAIVNTARSEPDGLGVIAEEDALAGRIKLSKDERVPNANQEKLLLIATVEELLRHEIALRETTEGGVDLVFPSQMARELPEASDIPGRALILSFEGPVQNIYSTLAVRLARSRLFKNRGRWRNAATFEASVGGVCGIYLREIGEGHGELTVFFDEHTNDVARLQFQDYIVAHLERRALPATIRRQLVVACPNCGEALSERSVTRRRELGHSSILCPVCERSISILPVEERLRTSNKAAIAEMDRSANLRRDRDATVTSLKGKMASRDFDVFLSYNSRDRSEVKEIAGILKARGLLPWLDEWEIRPGDLWSRVLENKISNIRAAAVLIGSEGMGPWQDLEQMAVVKKFVDAGSRVIPTILKSCDRTPLLPAFLELFHKVDFRQDEPDPINQLIWGILGEPRHFEKFQENEDEWAD